MHRHDVVICGAGILGASAAYFLSRQRVRDILLVDERPPLSLTSDRSTECYRNWWPDPEMLALMNRSIDLMEGLADESGNAFHLNRRGYLYVTAQENKIPEMKKRAEAIASLGAGPLRIHESGDSGYPPTSAEGFHGQPEGADLLVGNVLIHKHFPYLTEEAAAALHVRRAGWLSAQQMGMAMLAAARDQGVQLESARLESVDVRNGRVEGVRLSNGERIESPLFVNAAGPFLKSVGSKLGVELPVETEVHLKVAFRDHLGVVGREAPLLIWDDPQELPWESDELASLKEDPELHWLTEMFPAGAHTRPEGSGESRMILMLWEYKTQAMEPRFPVPLDDQYPEVALRGLARMLPRLREYFGKAPRPILDGGYYTRTRENRLIAGPTGVEGAYVIGAASGYGIMSACGAGELLAAYIAGKNLPSYAPAFSLRRYDDPAYQKQLETWGESGQL